MGAAGPGRERGVALMIVLWMLVSLALIGHLIALSARSETRLAASVRRLAVLEAAADGGVAEAMWRLEDPPGAGWAADGLAHTVTIGGTAVEVAIEDDSGKINPNLASPELLSALFEVLGVAPADAGSVVDEIVIWRTRGAAPARQAADLARYRASGLAWGPAYAPFVELDDLRQVRGITPALFRLIRPSLSLNAAEQTDLSAAPPAILAALAKLGEDVGKMPPPHEKRMRVLTVTSVAGGDGASFARRATIRQQRVTKPLVLSWSVDESIQ